MNKKRALHPRQKKVSGEVLLFLSYFSVFRKEDHLRYHPLLQEHLLEETHLAAFRP